jgi:hypothetical protein
MFNWFRRTSADTPQPFRHLRPGGRCFVARPFVDYDQIGHSVGECWTFVRHAFLPYEDGLTLVLAAPDKRKVQLRLQCRPNAQGPIVDALDAYFSPVEPALPSHRIATTRDSVCLADDMDHPHAAVVTANSAADMGALAETLLAANALAHVGSNAGWWFAARRARVALGFHDRMPFVRIARTDPGLRAGDIARLHLGYAAQLDPDALVTLIVQER